LATLDATLICLAWIAAAVFTQDAWGSADVWSDLPVVLPLAVVITMVCQAVAGLYSGVWRFASVREARLIIAAQLVSGSLVLATFAAFEPYAPYKLAGLATIFTCALIGGVRFQSRLFAFRRRQSTAATLVVIGAGSAGVSLARDVQRGDEATVAAFVDDDPRLLDRRVQGIPVQGTLADLADVVRRVHATHAVLAIPSASADTVQRVATLADEAGIVLRVVPPVTELVNGDVMMRDVRDLGISDLLGRDQIETDLSDIVDLLQGRRVLVTGAGGSIGSEISRQVAKLGAARVILVDHDETHLFDTAADLPETAVQRLADVREMSTIERVFEQERPQVVFHAAAHKHVPLLEEHPVEAVQTNVLGTRNVVRAARRVGVERFVFISTDKAVRCSSVMGASKAVGEQVVLAPSGSPTGSMTCCAVRFGNVLGSRGSVVPTFMKQIRTGGPVTITDARMTRYFMSIPEAVRLVLHAAALAKGGEVFMLDMGDPVRIMDLASRMIRLSGRRPGLDVEIRVTGIRPGEKLAEQLHADEERQHETSHPSIVRLDPVSVSTHELEQMLAEFETAAVERDDTTARAVLRRTVLVEPGGSSMKRTVAWT
jgi:FlaA1/EpsC-like NDP-sugar epimerase